MALLTDSNMQRFQRSIFIGNNEFSVRKIVSHTSNRLVAKISENTKCGKLK